MRRASHLRPAYHEAGHAIVAMAHGHRVASVSIRPDAMTRGRVVLARGLGGCGLRPARERLEANVCVLLGGVAAEDVAGFRRNWHGAGDDIARAIGRLASVTQSEDEMAAYLRFLLERTKNLLTLQWSAVLGVAKALMSHGEISGVVAHSVAFQNAADRAHEGV